jgi:Uma2 family endonuclease
MEEATMAAIVENLIRAGDFALLPDPADGSRQELVRGVIRTMPPPGFAHGRCQLRAATLIDHHVRPKRLGRVVVESGLVTERDPDTVRGPDVSLWSAERLPLDQNPTGYPDVAADLCVEVMSPSNTLKKILDKMREYFTIGVRMVWIIDPEDRTIRVYRSPEQGQIYHEAATFSGEDVLPGFTCKVSELFE